MQIQGFSTPSKPNLPKIPSFRINKQTANYFDIQPRFVATKLYSHEVNPNRVETLGSDGESSTEGANKHPASTFWYSRDPLTTSEVDIVPCDPNWDKEGLPPGSYKNIGLGTTPVKPTCLTTIGLDPFQVGDDCNSKVDEIDVDFIVSSIHKYIDSGFTSFQMMTPSRSSLPQQGSDRTGMEPTVMQSWMEQCVLANVMKETPNSILNQCNFATKIATPTFECLSQENIPGASLRSIARQQVGDSIQNLYGCANGCLDTLQVEFGSVNGSPSPLTFDLLDALFDMQREGLIRSITGLNFCASVIEEADRYGFHLDSNQISCNLLDPTKYAQDMYPFLEQYNDSRDRVDSTRKIIASSALAGGLLNEKYLHIPDTGLDRRGCPIPSYMSSKERRHYNNFLRQRKKSNSELAWHEFSRRVLGTLEIIAEKHEVTISSVALRWAMQLDHIGSIIIGCGFSVDDDWKKSMTDCRRLKELYSFHLDSDDMEMLWNI